MFSIAVLVAALMFGSGTTATTASASQPEVSSQSEVYMEDEHAISEEPKDGKSIGK